MKQVVNSAPLLLNNIIDLRDEPAMHNPNKISAFLSRSTPSNSVGTTQSGAPRNRTPDSKANLR